MDWRTIVLVVFGAVFSFLTAFAATPIVRKLSLKVGAMDIPADDRRMHKEPVPTMGGLAIFMAFSFGTVAFVPIQKSYAAVLLGAAVITLVGIMDDIFGLKWWLKLSGQIGAALIVAINGIIIAGVAMGTQREILFHNWSLPITVLWIVAITNAINLLDGLDGLACGVIGISCISLLIVASFYIEAQYKDIIIMIGILAGSCFGFLPYNLNPAKIFMGDTGAMLIGYVFAVLSIQGFFKLNALVAFGTPMIVLALPILDTILAFVRRIIHGVSFFKGDKKHIHHKLIEWGFNQKQSVLLLYTISLILGIAAILLTWRWDLWPLALFIVAGTLLAGAVVALNRRRHTIYSRSLNINDSNHN